MHLLAQVKFVVYSRLLSLIAGAPLTYRCNMQAGKGLMTVRAIHRPAIYRYNAPVYLQPVTK